MSTKPPVYDPTGPLHPGITLVQASAGTGKTYSIADSVVRFVAEQGVAIRDMLVVTFTKAATAELSGRIRRRLLEAQAALQGQSSPIEAPVLRKLAQDCPDDEALAVRQQRIRAALESYDEASIATIHGFCQRMLQQNAFESGAGFDTELVTDVVPLLGELVDDYWSDRLVHRSPAHIQALKDAGIKREDLMDLALKLEAEPTMQVLPDPRLTEQGTPTTTGVGVSMQFKLGFVRYLRQELPRRKRARQAQSYTDLLIALYTALRDPVQAEPLRDRLRQQYRVVLIDEFQDTDPMQWGIFYPVFGQQRAGESPTWLFLIGDPKQAIYSFRGADIHTYLQAAETAGSKQFTLGTNWRSDRRLVHGFNTLFDVPQVMAEPGIAYGRVTTPPKHSADRLVFPDGPRAPLELVFLGRERAPALTKNSYIAVGAFRTLLISQVCTDLVALLESGATLATPAGERPIQPRDIAVLVRKNAEALAIQTALQRIGVPSVRGGGGSVWTSKDATAVQRVLDAVAHPGREPLVRAALATPLLGYRSAQIDALDDATWESLYASLARWRHLWVTSGFIVMFRRLMADCEVAPRLLARTDGERRLTNVLHLAELLHTHASERKVGVEALASWLRGQRAHPTHQLDAAELRLESDADAIRLVTIHKSKGLQYPVVFCPFLWDGNLLKYNHASKRHLRFVNENGALCLDMGTDDKKQHQRSAESDMQAENLRLLYVALTRAEHRCVVYWGAVNNGWDSALGSLLHARKGDEDPRAVARRRVPGLSDGDMVHELRAIAGSSVLDGLPTIAVRQPTQEPLPEWHPGAAPERSLAARVIRRTELDTNWRRGSFTGLVRQHAPAQGSPEAEGIEHADPDLLTSAAPTKAPQVPLAAFERSAQTGLLWHAVLEHADFTAPPQALAQVVRAQSQAQGTALTNPEALAQGLYAALQTPLGGPLGEGALAQVATADRLNELDFFLPVAGGYDAPTTLGVSGTSLQQVFMDHKNPTLPARWIQHLGQLGARPLRGFLTGSIDLVFRRQVGGVTQWFLADYKSNWLGDASGSCTVTHYHHQALHRAMTHHHYYLQYHLYTVALDRYLRSRLGESYSYERNFGGAYYLFLRGMTGPQAPRQPGNAAGYGVVYDKPPAALIRALSEHLDRGTP